MRNVERFSDMSVALYAEVSEFLMKEELENDSDYLESGGSELLDED